MRNFTIVIITFLVVWVLDAYIYNGLLFDELWREAKQQNKKIGNEVRYWIKYDSR